VPGEDVALPDAGAAMRIVKLQTSVYSSDRVQRVLAYDMLLTIQHEQPVTSDILKLLRGRPKAFFFAEVDAKGMLQLHEEAPWQEW